MTVISSVQNARVKQLRALAHRKERDRTGLFLIEGTRAVGEAVQAQAAIEWLVVAPALLTSPYGWELVAAQRAAGVPCVEVTAEVFQVFEDVGFSGGLQGLGAVVRQRWQTLASLEYSSERCWVALDAIQYPGNLGTILRTSDAVGGAGVILLGQATDPYHPAAVRASLGAIFAQHLIRAGFAEFAAWKTRQGWRVVGTSPAAIVDYRTVPYQAPVVLLMGSERLGLSPSQQALCDTVVTIPMVGRSDSLNLGVATSLLLYEVFRQQRPPQVRSNEQ